ncbi:MAG: hypothetical protein QOE42_1017 [Chloroflexota bacterium]|nr:hypothetical protein [Chloroflexota bacterium]
MAEGIVYLDVDDEITSAAQRIRSSPGTKVALVVPYGSRIATSRMNFRLLSREAVVSNRRLSIVSGDAAARSLAASAGLPVFGTVPEYEAAIARPADDQGSTSSDPVGPLAAGVIASETIAAVGPVAAGSPTAASDATPPPAGPTTPTAPAPAGGRKSQRPKRPVPADTPTTLWMPTGTAAGVDRPADDSPIALAEAGAGSDDQSSERAPGRSRAPLIAVLGIAALAVIVLAVGGYLFLPTASIALTPRRDAIGPIELTVSADPTATAVDATDNIVPAVPVDVPVQATRTFTTTGTKVDETTAHGSVTFTNYDTSSGVSIPNGSIVSTENGTGFRTQATVVLQAAAVFPAFQPTSDSVSVVATKPGQGGNVPANTIRVVPQGQDPVLLRVNNPAPTSGGTHTETPQVNKAEVDKAVAALQLDLGKAYTAAVAAGAGAPADTTLFPDTAVLGPVTMIPDPKTLVGQPVATFDLTLNADGTVIAVDPRPVRTIAERALTAQIDAKHRLVDGSVAIDVGEGGVGEDGQVTFQATARATAVMIVDANAIRTLVKGKTAADARAALGPFGSATVTLWPDWVTTVTGLDARLTVSIDDGPSANPGPSAGPSSPARPTGSPVASPSARASGRSGSAAP